MSRVLHGIGIAVLALMMGITGVDVFLRYVFNRPITGSTEIIAHMMAIIVGFGLAYCAVMKGHVTVDLVISRLQQRTQAVINAVTTLFSFGLLSIMTWQLCCHMKELFASGESSVVLLIPAFPFVALVALGSAILSLVFLSDLLDSISQVVSR